MHRLSIGLALFASLALSGSLASAQFGGLRAGVENKASAVPSLARLDRESAEALITIDGQAEMRVKPTEIRIVLAVTSEAQSAALCQQQVATKIKSLRAAWKAQGIADKRVVEDFIAIIPRYEWKVEKRAGVEVGIENRAGYRMQTNIHLAVPNDETAPAAFKAAFTQGITDIIAFDYWVRDLDAVKVKARAKAVAAARAKADLLLKALFEVPPRVINVQEQTIVRYPSSLYSSFRNSDDRRVSTTWRRNIPLIYAHRPKNTYYRGLFADGDVQAPELPMEPEISVVSTVRLYFESPAAKRRADDKKPARRAGARQ